MVREALAVSTNRTGWIAAEGRPSVADPAHGLVNPSLGASGGYKAFMAFPGVPDTGDTIKAKQLLQQAGVPIPYPIHFTYSGGTPTTDKQASVLAATWTKAGFKVTLEGLSDTYYDVIQNPANAQKYDITWAGWGADWPNASTVIPPLFDSRVNVSSASNGSDYGWYSSAATNAAIDAAYNEVDASKRNAMWAALDEALAKEVAYIPLDLTKFPRLHGSKVANYTEDAGDQRIPRPRADRYHLLAPPLLPVSTRAGRPPSGLPRPRAGRTGLRSGFVVRFLGSVRKAVVRAWCRVDFRGPARVVTARPWPACVGQVARRRSSSRVAAASSTARRA